MREGWFALMKRKIRDVHCYSLKEGKRVSLHEVSLDGDSNAVREIIETCKETDTIVNEKDQKGCTPIHYACASGSRECIQVLLSANATITEQSGNNRGVLHFAALAGNVDVVRFLIITKKLEYQLSMYDNKGFLPIHFAARSGSWELINFLTPYDSNQINKTTNHGMNIVHIAAEQGHYDLTKKLLHEWETTSNDIKFPPDSEGNTLLHFSAFSGNVDLYRHLENYYESKEIKRTRNVHGHSPIFEASVSHSVAMLQYVAESDPQLLGEHSVTNNTPLFCAVKSGDLDCVKYLLENTSYTNECDSQGRNIFHHAASSGNKVVVEFLVDTLPNSLQLLKSLSAQTKKSVLQFTVAAKTQDCDLLRWFLTNKKTKSSLISLVSHLDKEDYSLLHTACMHGNIGAIMYLLENHKEQFDIPSDLKRSSYLAISAEQHHLDVIRYLLKQKEITRVEGVHTNIIHRMGYCQHEEVFKELITILHMDVNELDGKGQSALHMAAQSGNLQGFRVLCKFNADINNVSVEGVNLLHSAAYGGNVDVVKEVVHAGFDVNEPISKGDQSTALHFAASHLNRDVIEFLVENNANVNAVNVHGVSVLHEACRNGSSFPLDKQKSIVEYLLQAGAWKSLRVEATYGKGSKQTPYDMASHNSICKILAAHDPSFSTDHNLIPVSQVEEFFTEDNILGNGNFGSVYKGELFGSTVALKLLKAKRCDVEYRFRMEVGIMAMIRHPNVCMLMGACVENNTYCLVMEYIPTTLESLIPTLSMDDMLRYSLDISRGMAWLHSREPIILHCDLKSDNILIDNGRAKVSDFGLSTLFDPKARAMMTEKDREIHQDITAPEVAQEQKYSVRSDIYSFGCCLFLMYWRGKYKFSVDTVCRLPQNVPGYSGSILVTLILKCCSHFAEMRYDSFQEIIDILKSIISKDDIMTQEVRIQQKIFEMDLTESSPTLVEGNSGYIEI